MRSHKLLIVSATMLASTTLAGVSFADNTSSGSSKSSTPDKTTNSSSDSMKATVTMPNAPSSSTTVTTGTGTTGTMPSNGATQSSTVTVQSTGPMPPSSPPTSVTTTTSAEDVTGAAPLPPQTASAMPHGESTTVYQHHRPNLPLIITGSALLVGTYVTTAAVSGANAGISDRDLFIPVVGPWINIADRSSSRENNTRDTVLIAGSGVLQGVGAIMVLTSFFVPESVPAARIQAGNVKMQVSPTAAQGGAGVGAVGTF